MQPEDGPIKGPKHVVVKFIVYQSVLINSSCVLTVDRYHIIFYRNTTGIINCSKHVDVFNVIHILQNKGIVHQVGN
jgi:hypothetical protein